MTYSKPYTRLEKSYEILPTCSKVNTVRLRSHRHESEFWFTACRSFSRLSAAFTVTCTSNSLANVGHIA